MFRPKEALAQGNILGDRDFTFTDRPVHYRYNRILRWQPLTQAKLLRERPRFDRLTNRRLHENQYIDVE